MTPSSTKATLNLDINLYPNPATNTLNISVIGLNSENHLTATIIDVDGKVVSDLQISKVTLSLDINVYSPIIDPLVGAKLTP